MAPFTRQCFQDTVQTKAVRWNIWIPQSVGSWNSSKWRTASSCNFTWWISGGSVAWRCRLWMPKQQTASPDVAHARTLAFRKGFLCDIRNVAMKFPEWFYCLTQSKPRDFIVLKKCLRVLQLAPLWFQRINASCVEGVALIRRVCFYISSQKWVIGF
jgi:hypothetical protein